MKLNSSSAAALTPKVLFRAISAVAGAIGANCEAKMMRAVAAASAEEAESLPAPASLRDHFAAQALQGFFAGGKVNSMTSDALLAKWAYTLADTMLAARGAASATDDSVLAQLVVALKDCVSVMDRELNGLAVIQPELRQARAALAAAGVAP